MFNRIERCRLCQAGQLETILSLGNQALTGLFPKKEDPDALLAPLELVKCRECHLVQLAHNFDLGQLYGATYGYRSGLNLSMVKHLSQKVAKIQQLCPLEAGDLVIDIGSNDGTTLGAYPEMGLQRIGMDPSGAKFLQYYKPGIELIADFFCAKKVQEKVGPKKAKVITSIAMFYDLEEPQNFVNEIASLLGDDGVWVFEQSYLPAMLEANSYDTICHEHLEYYGLSQIARMLDRAGLKIVEIEHNDVNGGSFSITAAKKNSRFPECTDRIRATLQRESGMGLDTIRPFEQFRQRVEQHRTELKNLLNLIHRSGLKLYGYGASTKGNVLLQFCGLDSKDLPAIAEVNPDKFGAKTPGSQIPIISEADAKAADPDLFLVLPWHFRENILKRERAFLEVGGAFLFPLPHTEIVTLDRVYRGAEALAYITQMQTTPSEPLPIQQ